MTAFRGGASRMSALALALSAGGCTSLLGIDGHYVDDVVEGAGGRGNGSRDAASPAFDAGSGGVHQGAGGSENPGGSAGGQNEAGGATALGDAGSGGNAASAGGTGVVGPGGASATAGGSCGASCPPPPRGPCTAGVYTGPQKGNHAPSVTFVGVPLPVTGTVSFRLQPNDAGTTATILDGSIDGQVIVAGGTAPFSASISGTVDCQTKQFNASLDGKFSLTPNTQAFIAFSGTYTGSFSGTGFSGSWAESENVVVNGTKPYKGSGTWSASWSAP